MIEEDLHVFIPNTEKIDESVKQFVDMYSLRTRKNREYWLIDINWILDCQCSRYTVKKIGDGLKEVKTNLRFFGLS